MSKIILITGANRGIGFCIAQGIAQRLDGCCILVASRKLSAAEDAISKLRHLKATFEPVELEITSDDSIKACLESIETKHGRLDGTSPIDIKVSTSHS
jgi:NAD(P)-dependent dehydrogenase (short-subunit alcohol dehydrogenase family)